MLGFLLDNGNDQLLSYNINMISKDKPCHVFSSSLIPSLNTNVMQRYEAFHFNGIIITDNFRLSQQLKNLGYYFAEVETFIEELDNNRINLTHKIDLGNKAKINKISFVGNKIFKDGKLRGVIISEEYKFWKIISGRKYLNENTINFDKRYYDLIFFLLFYQLKRHFQKMYTSCTMLEKAKLQDASNIKN